MNKSRRPLERATVQATFDALVAQVVESSDFAADLDAIRCRAGRTPAPPRLRSLPAQRPDPVRRGARRRLLLVAAVAVVVGLGVGWAVPRDVARPATQPAAAPAAASGTPFSVSRLPSFPPGTGASGVGGGGSLPNDDSPTATGPYPPVDLARGPRLGSVVAIEVSAWDETDRSWLVISRDTGADEHVKTTYRAVEALQFGSATYLVDLATLFGDASGRYSVHVVLTTGTDRQLADSARMRHSFRTLLSSETVTASVLL